MIESLRALLILQDADQQLAEARGVVDGVEAEIRQLRQRLAAREAQTQALVDAARLVETARQKLDLDAGELRQRIVKYRAQQNLTRKNEEYAALLHEIDHAEKEIVRIEDEELGLMERYETARAAADADRAKLAELKASLETQEARVRDRAASAASRLQELEPRRQQQAAVLEAGVLARYERLLSAKGGRVIVPLQHGTTCAGCHMGVTHQTAIECRKLMQLVSCDNCGRFLYPEDWQAPV
jgi:predicted  nucleic acid-binding Zn-ribbon protein